MLLVKHNEDAREQVEKLHGQIGTLQKLARTLQQEVRVLKMGKAMEGEAGNGAAAPNGLHSTVRDRAPADLQQEPAGRSMLAGGMQRTQ